MGDGEISECEEGLFESTLSEIELEQLLIDARFNRYLPFDEMIDQKVKELKEMI